MFQLNSSLQIFSEIPILDFKVLKGGFSVPLSSFKLVCKLFKAYKVFNQSLVKKLKITKKYQINRLKNKNHESKKKNARSRVNIGWPRVSSFLGSFR